MGWEHSVQIYHIMKKQVIVDFPSYSWINYFDRYYLQLYNFHIPNSSYILLIIDDWLAIYLQQINYFSIVKEKLLVLYFNKFVIDYH